jgi:hypothetical protein
VYASEVGLNFNRPKEQYLYNYLSAW